MANKEVTFRIKLTDEGTFKKVTVDADQLKNVIGQVKGEVDKLNASVLNVAQLGQVIDNVNSSVSQLHSMMASLTGAYAVQVEAETKLATTMRNSMDATDADIESIKALTAAQQELGVVGDEVQMAGAQELATYLEKKESLEALIPVMNDMQAQQYGLNATTESAVTIASMLGKVMEGQVGALSRYGYSFSEAQAEILKFGTEEERVAVLVDVVTSAVGGMNAELAKTDAGRQKQLANAIGDIKEQVGALMQSAMPWVTMAAEVTMAASGVAKLVVSLKALVPATTLATAATLRKAVADKVGTLALNLLTASSWTANAGLKALRVTTIALYAAMTGGLYLAVQGLISLLGSLGGEAEETADGLDSLKEATDAYTKTASQAKAEMDMETAALKTLIEEHGDLTEKVKELNQKYGEAMGYHQSASAWYDTLVEKSQAYCRQLGYEAQAKVLAAKKAELELKLESMKQDGSAYIYDTLDPNDPGVGVLPTAQSDAAREVQEEIKKVSDQWDKCLREMSAAQQELKSTTTAQSEATAWQTMSYNELGRAIERVKAKVGDLAGVDAKEAKAQAELLKKMEARHKALGKAYGLTSQTDAKTDRLDGKKLVEDAKTYKELGNNIAYYQNQLEKTDPSETAAIRKLSEKIQLLKAAQQAIARMQEAAGVPVELDTLEKINQAISHQTGLRARATADELEGIDQTIRRLNDLKRAFEDQSAVLLDVGEIHTYEELEEQLSLYENRLKRATEDARPQLQQHIMELQRLKKAWDEALSEKPDDIARLNTMARLEEAIAYYDTRMKQATADELEGLQRVKNALEAKRDAMKRLTELPAMQMETEQLGSLSGQKLKVELELVGLEGIKTKLRSLQKMLDDTRNPLGAEQRKEVEALQQTWRGYEAQLRRSQVKLTSAWGTVKGLGNGIQSMSDALRSNGNAWQKVTGLVDSAIAIYEGVMGVIKIIDALTAVTNASTATQAASATASTAAATAKVAVAPEEVAAATMVTSATKTEAMAMRELAASSIMAAHASIPFVGVGIALGQIATMQAAVASVAVTPLAKGGMLYGPTLALMGEYSGASSNPEVVAPLDRLQGIMVKALGGGMGGKVEFVIKGRNLSGVLQREQRAQGRA